MHITRLTMTTYTGLLDHIVEESTSTDRLLLSTTTATVVRRVVGVHLVRVIIISSRYSPAVSNGSAHSVTQSRLHFSRNSNSWRIAASVVVVAGDVDTRTFYRSKGACELERK